jgi:RimJ/RimL family protein N-acetyltransferase
MLMPDLITDRLVIRPFRMDDLDAAYQLLDIDLADAETGNSGPITRAERERRLTWASMNYGELAELYQPPYGDRAIESRETGELIGAAGFVPCLGPFGQLTSFASGGSEQSPFFSTEFGLYWAVAPAQQRKGYATEAGRALIDYAFSTLNLHRVVATTTYDNEPSIAVMRKLGMNIQRNPLSDPFWFQAVGVILNPLLQTRAGLKG